MRSKKASLELSINAIVILILAITMLGLGLGFMRNIFGGATDQFQEMSGTVQKQMLEQMKESGKTVELNRPKITIKAGDEDQVFIGFKNVMTDEDEFMIPTSDEWDAASNPSDPVTCEALGSHQYEGSCEQTTDAGADDTSDDTDVIWLEYKGGAGLKTIVQGGQVVVLPINVKTSSSVKPGTYFFDIPVESDKGVDEHVELTVDVLA